MSIKLYFDENGQNLQEIIEEYLVDFYYENYEQELVIS